MSVPLSVSEELWLAVQQGEARAWKELVQRFQSLVYAIASRSGLSSMEMADCFQHTWVALYQHRQSISDVSRLAGWLATTTRREAIRLSRERNRGSALESIAEPIDDALPPDEAMEATERQFAIEDGLRQIDPRCRKLLTELFFTPEDTSYDQLAAGMNLSINAIGPFRKRCLERLRKALEFSGYLPARTDHMDTLESQKRMEKPPEAKHGKTGRKR